LTACYIVASAGEVLLLDEGLREVAHEELPMDKAEGGERLLDLTKGEPIPEIESLVQGLDCDSLVVESDAVAQAVSRSGWKGGIEVDFPSEAGRSVRGRLSADADHIQRIREISREISSQLLRETYRDWDRLVIQAVEGIDEIDRSMANLYARCREWYAIHFPELERVVRSQIEFSEVVLDADPRSSETLSQDLGVSEHKRRRILKEAENSIGTPLGESDLEAVREIARSIIYLDSRKSGIASYLEDLMEDHAPSLTRVAEPGVGARLISKAGSMKKLAMMPSTSIQTLGAEKALFRHVTKGAKPPKHGTIFQHPYVRNSPKSIRGKAASILAAKISLAARSDFISRVDKGEMLKSELDAAIKELRKSAG